MPALARPLIANFLKASARTDGDFSLYDYTSGTSATNTTQAQFTAGTLVGTTATANPGSVSLTGVASWWNNTWGYRQCFTVAHTAAGASTVTEYPVSVTLDTAALIAAGKLQASGADFRAISSTGTVIPMWLEGTINTTTTVVWAQIPTITAGASTQFCLYYGNATAPSVSDPLAPFTYTSFKSVYYPVSRNYASAPTTLKVATFGPSNQVKTGATTIALATAGATGTFASGIAQPSQPIQVLGPINGRGTGNGFDAIVPISFAGTSFVVPLIYLATSTLSILAPYSTASVAVSYGGVPLAGSPFTVPAGTSFLTPSFPSNTVSAVVTSNVPVLISHVNTASSMAAIPLTASTSTWYGVLNTWADAGFSAAGSATFRLSDGTSQTVAGVAGGDSFITGGGTAGGAANEGLAVTGTVPITAYVDSGDAATFLPAGELSSQYVLPSAATYVSFSCPTIGTAIKIGLSPTPVTVSCTTTGAGPFPAGTPGKALYTGVVPAGTLIQTVAPSTNPFYMYYADTGKETNVWGPKHGRQVTYPAPLLAGSVEEVNGLSGTWESPVINTAATGVFGTISWGATLPVGTAVTFKVAGAASVAGPWTYVGPDGTAATSYLTSPGALPFSFDGLCCVRVLATLTSTSIALTPLLNDVTVVYDLAPLAHTAGTASVVSFSATAGSATTAYLVRVKTASAAMAGSTATLRELGTSSNLANLTSATAGFMPGPVSQIVVTAGVVTMSVGAATSLDNVTSRSIVVTAQPTAAGITSTIRSTLTLDVGAAGGSPLIENDLDLRVLS